MMSLLVILILLCLVAYFTRRHWTPKVEELRDRLRYSRLPFFRAEEDTSFEQNIEDGLSSSTFDLHQNLLDGGKLLFSALLISIRLCLPTCSHDKSRPTHTFCRSITDGRQGVENGDELRKIMKKYRCNFDQARLIYQQNQMKANGIDPLTGVPIDPKAVYFS